VVTTLAGLPGSSGTNDGTGNAARFYHPSGVALDSAGNVYVADSDNFTVRQITPVGATWVVSTLAGAPGSPGSNEGTGSAAQFDYPSGVAVDRSGNVYVADSGNSTIRLITPAGANWVVSTLAGLAGSPGANNGTGSGAQFRYPDGVAVDTSGNVYVADSGNNTIRLVTPAGVVTTLAGLPGSPGTNNGTGSGAQFNYPASLAVDGAGNIYVADYGNNTIRQVIQAGANWVVSTMAGLAGSGGSANGTGSAARFYYPVGVALDSASNVYVADYGNNTIRLVTPAGVVTTLAGLAGSFGNANGTGSAARFSSPAGVAVDGAGNTYVADSDNDAIREITPAGVVTTLAGGSYGTNDGTGSAAQFFNPQGVAVDTAANVYVADTYNNTIRQVTPAGVVTTLAGLPGTSGTNDGAGTNAQFRYPASVAVDRSGNLYVADSANNTIRKVTPPGAHWVVSTLAGSPGYAGNTDGTGYVARFNNPESVAVDAEGNVYVADANNNSIRKVSPAGVVTTLGGSVSAAGSADATGIAAQFNYPSGVAVDAAGNVYVADTDNDTLRVGSREQPALIVAWAWGLGGYSGQFGLNLTGSPGQWVVMLATTNLMTAWQPIWTNSFVTGALPFTDPQTGANPHRYYRTMAP
jgi:sugar lactone lactonase YvrE